MSKRQNKTYVDTDSDEILTDQELQRAYLDARAEEEKSRLEAGRSPDETDEEAVEEELLEEAEDAITEMEARERRRDTMHRTGGDDHSPGIDTDMDANAPKELGFAPGKRGANRT